MKCSCCGSENYVEGNLVNMTVNSKGIWAWTMCRCYDCGHEFFEGRLFQYYGRGCHLEPDDYRKVLQGGDVNCE